MLVTACSGSEGETKQGSIQSVNWDEALRVAAAENRTYLRAAPSQEAAAEVLGLPFSTYRRHLGRAVDQLTEALWAVEIGVPGPAGGSEQELSSD